MRATFGKSLKIGCHLRLKIKEHLSDLEREGTDSSKVDRERRDHNALLNTFQIFLRLSGVCLVEVLNARRAPKWKEKGTRHALNQATVKVSTRNGWSGQEVYS